MPDSNPVTDERTDVLCRFDDGMSAVGRYAMSAGCVCFPDDREQDLCAQHAISAEPLVEMHCVVIYQPWFYEGK